MTAVRITMPDDRYPAQHGTIFLTGIQRRPPLSRSASSPSSRADRSICVSCGADLGQWHCDDALLPLITKATLTNAMFSVRVNRPTLTCSQILVNPIQPPG